MAREQEECYTFSWNCMKARLASDRIANRFQDRVDFLKGVQQASAATEGHLSPASLSVQ